MHTHSERRRRWRQQLLSREVTEAWPSSISSSSSRAARPGDVATSPVRTSRRVSSPADKATGSACVYTSKRRRLPCTALYARTARRPTPVRIPFHRDRVTAGADRLSYIQHVLSSSLLLLLCYSPFCILYVYKIYIYIYTILRFSTLAPSATLLNVLFRSVLTLSVFRFSFSRFPNAFRWRSFSEFVNYVPKNTSRPYNT